MQVSGLSKFKAAFQIAASGLETWTRKFGK